MEREIKFRVWCVNKQEWEKDFVLLTPNGGIVQLKNGVHIPCRPETHIVQFFTGLKDKNGREIYEGDIATCNHGESGLMNFGIILPMGFYAPQLKIVGTTQRDLKKGKKREFYSLRGVYQGNIFNGEELKEYIIDILGWGIDEIIGNIYENPELLAPQSTTQQGG